MWYDDVWNNRLHAVRAHRSFIHYARVLFVNCQWNEQRIQSKIDETQKISFSFHDYDIVSLDFSLSQWFLYLFFFFLFSRSRISRRFLFILLSPLNPLPRTLAQCPSNYNERTLHLCVRTQFMRFTVQRVFLHLIFSWQEEKQTKHNKTEPNRLFSRCKRTASIKIFRT